MKLDLSKEIEDLTKKLVSINSVDGNEKEIADYIYNYLHKLPYYKKHVDYLYNFDCGEGRNSVIAYLKGKGNRTIILMGHIDTVDIKDYGKMGKYATHSDRLVKALKENFNLSKEVIDDIESGNYLFGRGSLDMKSGVAAELTIVKYFAKHIDELDGNLLVLLECDEEGDSKGVIKALDVLEEIKAKENFEYVACINSDYSTTNDLNHHVYFGTVGKLLPCFVAIGKECHVGDPFSGFDPNLLVSLINKNIAFNTDLIDEINGKTSVPPICLKQTDGKDLYTVQTATSSFVYFNYMIYSSTLKQIMNNCLKIAKSSFNEALELMNLNYKKYCLKNSIPYKKISIKPRVFTYSKWNEMLKKNPKYEKEIKDYGIELLNANPKMDIREYSYKLVLKSYEYYQIKEPVLIVFFGSTFYSNSQTTDKKLITAINKAISTVSKDSKYNITADEFYPYISDMSFLCTPYNKKQIKEMEDDCPFNYNYPYEKIKKINVPVINIGTYGKDGHTYIERVQKDYTFNEMPNLIYETIIEYFKS